MTNPEPVSEALSEFQLRDYEKGALRSAAIFPLVDALFGRRSRRFFRGAEVPDGPLAYKSRFDPLPLSELERLLLVLAVGGRTFPSAAGFHTSQIFFTDDSGTYFFGTRDTPVMADRDEAGREDLAALLDVHRRQIRRLSDQRFYLPAREPYMEGHNTWVANRPGSLLVFPVGDLAQHTLLNLCFYVQNGYCIYDDVHHRSIPGMEQFSHLVNTDEPVP